ncbi:urease accessory UreF family protein [Arthrobacter sp. H14]|uniref:urease accessory UreF family protein n=1 Tax=Arthrobacter sp. H14 TaxID=1312959 RepID=UPI0004AD4A94|nr:urease accessory UreF family protein [Arthrobacter sp. H14]
MPANAAALLLLADGRLPAGGYAHSGGLEAIIRTQCIDGAESLELFLTGRAATAGLVAGSFAAAACAACKDGELPRLHGLDSELDARIPSTALREVSRSLGRQLLRTATAIRPHPHLKELGRSLCRPLRPLPAGHAGGVHTDAAPLLYPFLWSRCNVTRKRRSGTKAVGVLLSLREHKTSSTHDAR